MPLRKDAIPLMREPRASPRAPLPWVLPSLFAAFNVVLLVVFSALFFAFPCRWLAQNGEWAFLIITGPLFILTFFSLVSLNFSDPGILHQGSNEQGPTAVHVVWVNNKAFRLQWCQKCCFHRPPRTYHCPFCNICVEDFDHHCKWVNNCIGHRNFRFFMLLVLSLCLYSGAVLVTCLIFLLRPTQPTLYIDKLVAILVAVPAACFLVPLFLLLLIQAKSVGAAERSCEGKCRYLWGYNPFDNGCASNWYLTICAPLGPKALWGPREPPYFLASVDSCPKKCRDTVAWMKLASSSLQGQAKGKVLLKLSRYMAKAVWLQRVVEPDWVLTQNLHSPMCPSALSPSVLPGSGSGLQAQPLAHHKPRNAPPGSGEAAALQELHAGPVLPLPQEAPR